MLKKIQFLTLFIFSCVCLPIGAETNGISQALNQILAKAPSDLNAGIIIQDLNTGKTLYQLHADRLFMPASNLKLFTAYAALQSLGANYSFTTAIYADTNKLVNGTLHDNVYLKFSGDPTLTSDQFMTLIQALHNAGIQRIEGQWIVDNFDYDANGLGHGWMSEDGNYCYGQPITSMIVDHNCFSLNILPAQQIGLPAQLQLTNTALPFVFDNQVKTATTTNNCELVVTGNKKNIYQIQGCVAATTPANPINIAISVQNVGLYISQLIKMGLQNNHIELTGNIVYGRVPTTMQPLAANNSKPLADILVPFLKLSDNLIANTLFKKMGEANSGQQGNWENSQKALQDILLTKLGLTDKSFVIVDGSGASRYNLVAPKQVLSLLKNVYKNPSMAAVFIPALPIAGTDGTLQNRMTMPEIKGKVLAKTGSMTGVSSLSGYIKTNHQHTLAFVILMNNFIGSENTYHELQDKICEYLIQHA